VTVKLELVVVATLLRVTVVPETDTTLVPSLMPSVPVTTLPTEMLAATAADETVTVLTASVALTVATMAWSVVYVGVSVGCAVGKLEGALVGPGVGCAETVVIVSDTVEPSGDETVAAVSTVTVVAVKAVTLTVLELLKIEPVTTEPTWMPEVLETKNLY